MRRPLVSVHQSVMLSKTRKVLILGGSDFVCLYDWPSAYTYLFVCFNVIASTDRHVARAKQPKLCEGARAQKGDREGAMGGPWVGSFRPGYRNYWEGKKHINLYFILKNICGKISFVCEGEGGPTHSSVEWPGAAGDVPAHRDAR